MGQIILFETEKSTFHLWPFDYDGWRGFFSKSHVVITEEDITVEFKGVFKPLLNLMNLKLYKKRNVIKDVLMLGLLFLITPLLAQPKMVLNAKKNAKGAYVFKDGYKNSVDEKTITFSISSSQILITKFESRICQVKDWDSKGTPMKPENPYFSYKKGISQQSEYLVIDGHKLNTSVKTNNSIAEKHMKDPMAGKVGYDKYGIRRRRADDIYAPWKFSYTSTITYTLDDLARKEGITKRDLACKIITANSLKFTAYSNEYLSESYAECIQECLTKIFNITNSEISQIKEEKARKEREIRQKQLEEQAEKEAKLKEQADRERSVIREKMLGWQYISSNFPKFLKIKKIRVKKGNSPSQYCCVFFSRYPDGNRDSKFFAVNLYTGGILDNADNENWLGGAIKRKNQIKLEDKWYEYEFSQDVYFSEIQQNANPSYVKVLVE